jgi:hypothetical protein
MAEEGGVGAGLVLKEISVLKDMVDKGQGGISYTSDQITYPKDLERVDDTIYSRTQPIASIHKSGYVYHSDDIVFYVHGEFRAYDQLILNDPNSVVTPVMANVYVDLDHSEKAGLTQLEIHFTALQTPFGSPEDPRIRFVCDGHYDPAGSGDTRFRAVVEIDGQANVNVVESEVTGGDGVLTDNSPKGFDLTVEGN